MTAKTVALAALGGAMLFTVTSAVPAAAIECQGRSQWNSAADGWITTPYCSDNLIAAVARQNGMNVSNRAVRQNPSVKREACMFAGADPRISDLCAGNRPEDLDSFRR